MTLELVKSILYEIFELWSKSDLSKSDFKKKYIRKRHIRREAR